MTMSAITLHARPSANFDEKLAATLELLKTSAAQYNPITQASSLGVEDVVVTHLLHMAGLLNQPGVSVFVLETGRLHKETLALIPQIEAKYATKLDIYYPKADSVEKYVADHGLDAIYQSIDLRKACCDIRKMEPLARALAGKAAWITGLRREQSNARAEVGAVEFDGPKDAQGKPTRAKINPLIDWTLGDVWHFVSLHAVPYNPLHDQFFPSIGCEPCTRAVTLGEDFRSGRWWWEDEAAKECGLHVKKVIPISEVSA